MNIQVKAELFKFNKEKYLKAVNEAIKLAFTKGAQQFLLAAVPKIPIYTGFSRGAFRELEELVGKVTKDAQSGGYRIRTTRSAGEKRGAGAVEKVRNVPARHRYYYPPGGGRVFKTNQSGRPFAKVSFPSGVATVARGRAEFIFKFTVDITYVDKLDKTRWGAFKAGEEAMMRYIEARLELPDPVEFIGGSTIQTGG